MTPPARQTRRLRPGLRHVLDLLRLKEDNQLGADGMAVEGGGDDFGWPSEPPQDAHAGAGREELVVGVVA